VIEQSAHGDDYLTLNYSNSDEVTFRTFDKVCRIGSIRRMEMTAAAGLDRYIMYSTVLSLTVTNLTGYNTCTVLYVWQCRTVAVTVQYDEV
jgi:hypothetical protein